MKKLVLELDDLRVESFSTAEADSAKGTVNGHIIIGSGGGCSVFNSCEATACGCGGGGGSGHYTCGVQAACGDPDSDPFCRTDVC